MILDSDVRLVGRVNKTHGTDGELSVTFFDDTAFDVVDVDTCLFFKIDGILVPFFVTSVRPRGGESLLVAFDDIESQESAAQFVGMDVYIGVDQLPENAEGDGDGLYAAQLIGFKAISVDGAVLGEIDDIDDAADNPLFVVTRPEGGTLLIPIVDDFIADINFDDRVLTFDLPEGLIDINN